MALNLAFNQVCWLINCFYFVAAVDASKGHGYSKASYKIWKFKWVLDGSLPLGIFMIIVFNEVDYLLTTWVFFLLFCDWHQYYVTGMLHFLLGYVISGYNVRQNLDTIPLVLFVLFSYQNWTFTLRICVKKVCIKELCRLPR